MSNVCNSHLGLCPETHELLQKLNQNFHSLLFQRNCVENKWFQKA